jgi:hypothetical protein
MYTVNIWMIQRVDIIQLKTTVSVMWCHVLCRSLLTYQTAPCHIPGDWSSDITMRTCIFQMQLKWIPQLGTKTLNSEKKKTIIDIIRILQCLWSSTVLISEVLHWITMQHISKKLCGNHWKKQNCVSYSKVGKK